MRPFVKWAGGKEAELKTIKNFFPERIENYIEPFLGGGAVFFDLVEDSKIKKFYVNDFSRELMDLYKCIRDGDEKFFETLRLINSDIESLEKTVNKLSVSFKTFLDERLTEDSFDVYKYDTFVEEISSKITLNVMNKSKNDNDKEIYSVLANKTSRLKKMKESGLLNVIEYDTILETILKSYYYSTIRDLYNNATEEASEKTAYFYYIREFCYSAMFRYNTDGKFNVPYGGSGYNNKNLSKKIEALRSERLRDVLKKSRMENLDFEKFIDSIKIGENDFIFVDPPYDSEFSEYAQNAFSKNDQERLAKCLSELKCKVMIVIKNTKFIHELYSNLGFKIESFEKKYNVNFMNRNERKVEHLIVKNY